jgi:hypothetical protein
MNNLRAGQVYPGYVTLFGHSLERCRGARIAGRTTLVIAELIGMPNLSLKVL